MTSLDHAVRFFEGFPDLEKDLIALLDLDLNENDKSNNNCNDAEGQVDQALKYFAQWFVVEERVVAFQNQR